MLYVGQGVLYPMTPTTDHHDFHHPPRHLFGHGVAHSNTVSYHYYQRRQHTVIYRLNARPLLQALIFNLFISSTTIVNKYKKSTPRHPIPLPSNRASIPTTFIVHRKPYFQPHVKHPRTFLPGTTITYILANFSYPFV